MQLIVLSVGENRSWQTGEKFLTKRGRSAAERQWQSPARRRGLGTRANDPRRGPGDPRGRPRGLRLLMMTVIHHCLTVTQ